MFYFGWRNSCSLKIFQIMEKSYNRNFWLWRVVVLSGKSFKIWDHHLSLNLFGNAQRKKLCQYWIYFHELKYQSLTNLS